MLTKTDLPPDTLSKKPAIDPQAFIARGAQVIGDVRLAAGASVWYNAVVRGDINYIEIGQRSNLQDGVIVHLENFLPCIVGNDVTVGHGAILHGCTIEDGCLIGMGAIVLSGAKIGRGSVIAAGALVKENAEIPPFSMMVGMPAKLLRTLDEGALQTNLKWAAKYVALSEVHRQKVGNAEALPR